MKTKEQMLVSRSAVGRILGALPHHVELQIWPKVVWVKVKGRKPRFISPKAFIEDFQKTRIENAMNLDYRAITNQKYVVVNPDNGNKYMVELHPKNITCTCEDYAQQMQVLEQPCCKHCYRILFALGYHNMIEYVERTRTNYGS